MRRALTLSYAALAYLAFLTAFAALADFLLGVGLVRSIDDGPVVPWPSAAALDLALIAAFGISHSVMARPAFKARWTRLVPNVVERSTYVLVASLVLGLIVWQWRALPEPIWEVEPPTARAALYAVFGLGAALVVVSTFLTSHFDLFGLRQAWLFAQDRPYEPVPFVERGLYRLVRHPMMVGLFVLLWAAPTLSVGHALFAAGMSAYIVVGVAFEERALLRELGAPYEDYRRRVRAFLPFRRA